MRRALATPPAPDRSAPARAALCAPACRRPLTNAGAALDSPVHSPSARARRRRALTRAFAPPHSRYAWIVVFGAIAAIFASFGIGANDVANAYATSVGSKALTIKQACGLAVIFEFLGAVLAGSNVAETIRKGIAKSSCYQGSYMDAALLMYGNLCVVGAIGIWLLLASYLEMPVSTTHSACGGLVGMAIVTKGSECVVWYKETGSDKLYIPSGITGIVLSWVISPVLSGTFRTNT